MNLTYITDSLPYGMSEAFVIPELRELVRRGHRIEIFPINPVAMSHVVHDDVCDILIRSRHQNLLSPRVCVGALAFFARRPLRSARVLLEVRKSRSVLVLLKNVAVYPKALWIARLTQRRNVEHIHAHWAAHTATVGLMVGKLLDIPWSFTAHRWDIAENNLLRVKAESAKFVRAIDRKGAYELARAAGIEVDRVRVIHMGVELRAVHSVVDESAESTASFGRRLWPDHPFTFVTVANLHPKKGHRYLLEAVAELKGRDIPVRLDVVGDGELRSDLEMLATRLGIRSEVTFRGWIPHGEMLHRLGRQEWDAMVLASVVTSGGQTEGIPVSLIEAMAAGVPTVSTTIGGIPELLDGGAGLMVEPMNSAALADALQLLATSAELRGVVRVKGRSRVRESFSIEAVVTELERGFSRRTWS